MMSHENGNKREAGKHEAELFVTAVAHDLGTEGSIGSLLWWPADPSGGGDSILPLRIYKGNSWGAIDFTCADVDGSVESPKALEKYRAEIARVLAGL
jgi:hypothetical protein